MKSPFATKTAIIYPAAFLMAVGLIQCSLGLVFFARDVRGAEPGTVGWLTGVWAITYAIGCICLRPWIRRLSAGAQILTAAGSACAVMLGMQVVPSLAALFVPQGLLGLTLCLYWPALMGWLSAGSEGGALGRAVSRFNMSWSVGNILGPLVCGWLLCLHVRLPLAAGAAAMLLIVVYVLWARQRHPVLREQLALEPGQSAAAPEGDGVDRSTPLRYPAWIGHFASYFAVGVVVAAFPLGARDELGYSEAWIGAIFLVRAAFNTLAFVWLSRTERWHFHLGPIVAAPLLAAGAFVWLIGAQGLVPVTLLLSVVNSASGISYSASIFHGASGSLDCAHRMAVHEALIGVSLFMGAASGGIAYEAAHLAGAYTLAAAVLCAAALLQVTVRVRPHASSAAG